VLGFHWGAVAAIHNLRGIFAAADAIAAVKLGDAPLY